jgi:hypothetical protein
VAAGVIVPVVLNVVTQQATGRENAPASGPPRVKPLKVIPMSVPGPALSKTAVAPGPATRVTPAGTPEARVLLNPARVAVVVPSKTLVDAGKTSMNWVSVAPPVKVKSGK